MLDDSHEWVLYLAGKALGKTTQTPAVVGDEEHWSKLFQSQLSRALTGKLKRTKTIEHATGYSLSALRMHLERQFSSGMNWGNYAGSCPFGEQQVWHIDHIIPKRSFVRSDVSACFALSNLRPVWRKENMRKGARRSHLL